MAASNPALAAVSAADKVADIGRYRLVAELARGGMGIVYLALLRGPGGFNKLFVVKVLKDHLAEDPNFVSMFLEEARVAAKLSHPNVVQTVEVGSEAGRHFIAMEYLDGQSFSRAIARTRRLETTIPMALRLHILVHLLEGLEYAHAMSDYDGTPLLLVHRDVSPQNLFLTYDGQVKILDFGIAKALGSSVDTSTGMLKGKVAYMAPEQAAGGPMDRRTDVFAVGVMLWEATVGKRMWDRSVNDLRIIHALVTGDIPEPRQALPDVDPVLERVILKATALNPADRYPTAAAMQVDLEACAPQLGLGVVGPRDLGRYVSELFAEDRAQMKGVIDAQLRLLKGMATGEYGRVDMPQLTPLTTSSVMPSAVVRVDTTGERKSVDVSSPAPPSTPRRKLLVPIVVLAGAAIVGAAAATAVFLQGRADNLSLAPPSAAPVASAPEPEAPPPATATAEPTVSATSAWTPVPISQPTASPLPHSKSKSAAHPPAIPSATAAAAPTVTAPSPPDTAPVQPPAAATSTAHVRQPIDTSNPYSR